MNLLTILEKSGSDLKQQGQKKIIIALFTGIGSVTSSLVGVLLDQLLQTQTAFYYGTILSSSILIPVSVLTGLSVWDKLKTKWSLSENLIFKKKYLEDELLRNLEILEKIGLNESDLQKEKKELYRQYKKKLSVVEEYSSNTTARLIGDR